MISAALRLLNAVQVDLRKNQPIPQAVFERTIKNGYILDPSIPPESDLLDAIERVVGLSGDKANAAFHKSWSVVQSASTESLISQQIIHYITTYGFERLGIYQKDAVYIPHEILNLPNIQDDIPLVAIKAMDASEILKKIINLGKDVALAQETLNDIMTIIKFNKYDDSFIEEINNRELKALLHDYYSIVPSDPIDFLRYIISKLTDESLLIKNNNLICKIKNSNGKFLDILLKDAPDNLASIFFRFKPLFLAMKSISNNKAFFNQLRKKANKLHAPMAEDYLNSITSQIKHKKLNFDVFSQKLEKATIFRKIRLAYALNYRLSSKDSIVYRIRNGTGWAKEFDWNENCKQDTQQALDLVLDSIAKNIGRNVNGKTFYIPENIHYALPASEKQFTGHLPTGSWVSVPEDLIVGINWVNNEKRRIDLDLSLIGVSGKIGWDGGYKSENCDILFSGDMTDAQPPHGATELFYIKEGVSEAKILLVNYFNYLADNPVECKIMAAHETPENFCGNYMVDVSNIISTANILISKKQNVIGLIININSENRVYFANVSIGSSITSSKNANSMHVRNYLIGHTVNSISLRQILTMAGAVVVNTIPEREFINLSPELLSKETLIDLIKPQY
jgi:hypothetical protein